MLTGLPPFYDENTNDMYRKILAEPLHFPGPEIVPPAARDLLTRLLDRDPVKRLGVNGAAEIKAHPFFHSIDWRKLLDRKYEPSFKPNVVSVYETFLKYRSAVWIDTKTRLTKGILPTSTASLLLRRPQTHTWKDQCSRKRCNSNSQAGRTTDQSRDLVMQAEVSKIHRS